MALSLLLSRYLFDTHLANNFAPIKSLFFEANGFVANVWWIFKQPFM